MCKVKIKDKDDNVHFMEIALNAAGLGVSYKQTDLIDKVIAKLTEKKGNADILDISRVQAKWEEKWDKYDKEQHSKP